MRRLLIVLLLLLAQPAQAQEYTATVSPETVAFGRDSQVTWRITIKTGDKPLDANLSLGADAVSPAQHGAAYGFLVTSLGDVRLEGPGELAPGWNAVGDPCWAFYDPLPLHGQRFLHGFNDHGVGGRGFVIEVPANSESVVVVSTPLKEDAPWPGTTYGLKARVDGTALDLPRAGADSPYGVPLSFTTEPAATEGICGERPRFAHGTVKVTGRTDPALSGDRVTVIDAQSDAARTVVGEPTVRPDGTFVLDGWTPAPGDHTLAVRYYSQRPNRTDDFAAPQWFAIKPPPPPPPPPAPPKALAEPPAAPLAPAAPEVLGTSRAAAGFVTVRLKCKSAGGCRGVARLSRKGRRLAARRYEMADGATAGLRLRLPARTWRSLRRSGRLAMEVQLAVGGGSMHSEAVTLLRR
jgi:hypothetical protein